MSAPWMPPLPEHPHDPYIRFSDVASKAIEAYGLSCARAALEQAAKVCDSVNNHDNQMTARDCADAIRALAREITP